MFREAHAHLERAKARLDGHARCPTPVRIDCVRIIVWPALFRLPYLRRFDGYATWWVILMRRPCRDPDHLLVHELCHVRQMQHHPIRMPLSSLRHGSRRNPHDADAREAAAWH